jgi:hypothetical protein
LEIAVETIKRWTTTCDVSETALIPVEVIAEVPGLGTGDHLRRRCAWRSWCDRPYRVTAESRPA